MLRLRSSVLTHLLSSPATYPTKHPVSSLHRLLSAAAPAISPIPSFVAEEYLVDTCGLTRAQALKASAKISHLKAPTKPDAVLAFLAGLGLSSADVAALVARDPQFLCAKVEKTLASNVAGLTGLGLSHTEIARLVSLVPASFRSRAIVSNLPYYLSLMGSYENLLPVLKRSYENLLSSDLERVVKPNVALLRECGLGDCDIRKLCHFTPALLNANTERLHAMVACAQGLGVPPGMFRYALEAVAFISEERVAAKVDYLKKTLRWSDAEVCIAVSKNPSVLKNSEESLKRRSDFFFSEVGLEPAYIAHRPVMLRLSLEGRLRPRYYVLKFLKENGLLKRDQSYDTVVKLTEKAFMEKFIRPYKEAAPHFSEDYVTACSGEVPTNFRFI